MPNWCSNDLVITGDDSIIKDMMDFVRKGDIPLCFDNILPVPKDKKDRDMLDWCSNNWGTKWDLDKDTYVEVGNRLAEYSFSSAWSPPEGVIGVLASKYPDLEFNLQFEEPGLCFYGYIKWEEGEEEDRHIGELTIENCFGCDNNYVPTFDSEVGNLFCKDCLDKGLDENSEFAYKVYEYVLIDERDILPEQSEQIKKVCSK